MNTNIKIEKLAENHRDSWAKLWKQYLDFYKTARSEKIYTITFHRLVSTSFTDCEGFIALDDGQGVGIVHCLYHIHLWQEKKICYLQDLYVDRNCRKQGVGGKLISRIYERTDELGLEGVYWTTQDFNMEARKLYDKIGKLTPFIKYVKP